MTHTRDRHVPVLFQQAIDFLHVRPEGTYVDCTLGMGGHAEGILRRLGPKGRLIGFDRDPEAFALASERLQQAAVEMGAEAPELTLIPDAFSSIASHVSPASMDGILADFGVSSLQLDEARRGFSFQADGPLDMRMDTRSGPTAEQVVNEMDERELADLIYEYGEERRSRTVARAVVRGRPITTTGQLARVVASVVHTTNSPIHPATRTFQALRIYVNRELDEIRALLEAAPDLLKPAGRVAVISFHSLEDRIVKDSLRDGAQRGVWQLLTKKPAVAEEEETYRNPRARSAKLRSAERTTAKDPGPQLKMPNYHR
jgi:16S rRNA (cytosine1402-N4)-methyltransferase